MNLTSLTSKDKEILKRVRIVNTTCFDGKNTVIIAECPAFEEMDVMQSPLTIPKYDVTFVAGNIIAKKG
jgi:hypothetical protein